MRVSGCRRFTWTRAPHHAEHLFLRVLPDGAGVDDDDIRPIGVPGEAAAHLPEHPHQALAVGHILLAPVGVHHSHGLAVRAAEEGGQPPGKFLLPPDVSGGEDHLCSVQRCSPRVSVEIDLLIIPPGGEKGKRNGRAKIHIAKKPNNSRKSDRPAGEHNFGGPGVKPLAAGFYTLSTEFSTSLCQRLSAGKVGEWLK